MLVIARSRKLFAGSIAVLATTLLFAAPALAAASAPAVTTGAASAITYQSATLSGTVNPGSESTEVYFQYGSTNKYGSQSAPTELAAGAKRVPVAISITGLASGTVYHYRLVATNTTGTALGTDRALKTSLIPLSLAITAEPNPVTFGGGLVVEGTLSGTNSGNAVVQLQANVYPYTAGFVNVGNPELTFSTGAFTFNVLDVTTSTEYRVVSGATASADVPVAVALGVTLLAQPQGTSTYPTVHFSGTITPAEPFARIAIERLEGTSWKVVGGTVAGSGSASAPGTVASVVNFGITLHIHSSGFFRALVLPVEGSHADGYSPPVTVKIK
jgi:hypothetical protein